MGRRLKLGLSILGILALMFAAFMLPMAISHVSGTWADYSSHAESRQNTFKSGFWISDEELVSPISNAEQSESIQEQHVETSLENETLQVPGKIAGSQ